MLFMLSETELRVKKKSLSFQCVLVKMSSGSFFLSLQYLLLDVKS